MAGGEAAAGGEVIAPPRSTLPVRVSVVGLPRAFPHADTTSASAGSYLGQLALLSQLADLAHDRRRMQADRRETEQRVTDLRPASWTRRTAQAAVAPPATHAKVNIMVCTVVETRGLDDAGTRRRLNKQPDHHHHFDARRWVEDSGLPGSR